MKPPIKNTAPRGKLGSGQSDPRAVEFSKEILPYPTSKYNLVYEDIPAEVIDWHLQAYQALRRAYKCYQLGQYLEAKAALFEFYYSDQQYSGGFCYGERNR